MQIDDVTDATAFDSGELEADWQRLVQDNDAATPFQTWEWCSSWWKHRGRGKLYILRARDGQETVGILPLVITRWRMTPLRQLRFVGAPLSDYQMPIVRADRALECAQAFYARLAERRAWWDFCDFADQPEGSALTEADPGQLSRRNTFHRVCPVIPLAPKWDQFLAGLGKSMRTTIGRRRRQLAKTFRTEVALAGADDLEASMTELFRLHNARWQKRGAAGAFADPGIQAFHQDVARRFLERGWLRLHLYRVDGRVGAAFYCFRFGARVFYYLSGFDLELGKFSIGNVAMSYAIEHAIGEGAREFDLLRGDESYKFAWNATEKKTMRILVGHGALRSRMALGAHRVERFIEHRGLALQRRMWGRKRSKPDTGGKA